jgi:hypothetical protein
MHEHTRTNICALLPLTEHVSNRYSERTSWRNKDPMNIWSQIFSKAWGPSSCGLLGIQQWSRGQPFSGN